MGVGKIEQLIEKTKTKYTDKEIVAFLGKVSSGKTVVAALIKYTLSTKWIPASKGAWEAVPSSGYDEINELIRDLKKGNYPSPTPKKNYPKLVIDLHNMEGRPVKFELILHDMSGENYADLLTSSDYSTIDDRLIDILSSDSAYIAYAKKYVIMIDCSEKNEWDTDIAQAATMLTTLRKIKQKIHNYTESEKLHTPIAIVFTKADLLDEEDKTKPTEVLAKDYPDLLSSLKVNHDGNNVEFFKVQVSSKLETDDEANTRVKQEEEKLRKSFAERMNTIRSQVQAAIDQAVSAAEEKARQEGKNEQEIQAIVEQTKKEQEEKHLGQLEQKPPEIENKSEKLKPDWKVMVPLSYSDSEYSRLISWILDQKTD